MQAFKISLLVLSLSISISGQWEWQNPIPTSNSLYGISFLNDTIVYVVGDGGFMMKSTDVGLTWKNINSQTSLFLNDIIFINYDNFIAVGHHATIVKSSDGGESWQKINSGLSWELYHVLTDIFFINQDIGWICGRGCVLKSTDGGNNWEPVLQKPDFEAFTSIHFFDPDHGLLCSWGSGGMYSTSDGGITWTPKYTGFNNFRMMLFTDVYNGYVVGENGLIIKTTDGGNTWMQKNSGTNKSLRALDFWNDTQGVIVGVDGVILMTSDAGESWIDVSNQSYTFGNLYDIANNNDGIFISVGVRGELIRSMDSGYTWDAIRQGYLNNLNSIWMLNQNEGWIVGDSGIILKTLNGGKTWLLADSLTNVNLNDIIFISDSIAWIVGDAGQVFRSNDFGENWEFVNQFGTPNINSIFFLTEMNGWAAGSDGSIFKTEDGGLTWLLQITNSNRELISVYFTNANNGWSSAINSAGDGVLKTTDGGNSWETIPYPSETVHSIYFVDELTGWMVGGIQTYSGDFGRIYSTLNGGESWQEFIYGVEYYFYDGFFSSSETGWIFGRRLAWNGNEREGVIASTSNGGETLNFQRSSTANFLFSAAIVNGTKIWVVGQSGTILKNDSAYVVTARSEENVNVISDHSLFQNYPNPFNPMTSIGFTISEFGFVSLKVYDVLGNEIATLINEEKPAGEYEIEFDGTGLPSGIYFYQLKSGNFIETRKMVLLK